jgi:hypothetical protein
MFLRSNPHLPLLTIAASLLIVAPLARADTITLNPDRDNTLYEDPTGSLSNGSGPNFFAGETANNQARRGLLHFNIAALPAGSTITAATLTLHVSRTSTGTEAVGLHRLQSDWGEGASVAAGAGGDGAPAEPSDATWLHTFYPDRFWTNPGGDFDPADSATSLVGGIGFFTWSTSPGAGGLAADIQAWLAAPTTNFGWLVQGDESFPQAAKRFDSRENSVAAFRPALSISFTPAPTPPAAIALLPLLMRRRRAGR